MIELYFTPMACSLAARITLEEAAIPANYIQVDRNTKRAGPSNDDFHLVSSMGLVPALRCNDGSVLTENSAILQYIADLAPVAELAPPRNSSERYVLQSERNMP